MNELIKIIEGMSARNLLTYTIIYFVIVAGLSTFTNEFIKVLFYLLKKRDKNEQR